MTSGRQRYWHDGMAKRVQKMRTALPSLPSHGVKNARNVCAKAVWQTRLLDSSTHRRDVVLVWDANCQRPGGVGSKRVARHRRVAGRVHRVNALPGPRIRIVRHMVHISKCAPVAIQPFVLWDARLLCLEHDGCVAHGAGDEACRRVQRPSMISA